MIDIEPWTGPMRDVACTTEGCENQGIVIEVADDGGMVVCGACGITIVEPPPVEPLSQWQQLRASALYKISAGQTLTEAEMDALTSEET